VTETELERIRSAYRARDADSETPYRWDNPGYVAYLQSVERAVLRALADAGVPLKGARVLDVGCGSGYFLHRFQEYGAGECHGIDLMETRIAIGRERYPTLKLRVGSATE
jgi:2-polyprenyl-3-methyl-5-hydroxy-6-metoxy-1,4-benzoquinol methylase